MDQNASIVDSVGPVDCSVHEVPGSKLGRPLVDLGLEKTILIYDGKLWATTGLNKPHKQNRESGDT